MTKWLDDVAKQIRGFAALPNWPDGIEAWPVDGRINVTYRGRVHQVDPGILVLHAQNFAEVMDKVFTRLGIERLDPPVPRLDTKVGPWRIYLDPPPIGTRSCDWHYIHDDYDGPESPAWMTGHCASREDCLAEIMEGYEDRAASLTPWGWLAGDQKLPGTYVVRTVQDRDDATARGLPVARLYIGA